jgi:structural maintenance of chromosome 4
MLFVFGKRAKKLRLNKVSELIHKSDAVKDAQFARVSVYFEEIIDTGDGDDDYEVIPNTERVVTRIARKDNSSCYKLDGKNCAFKDVAAYLGSKGIDLDNNRFLILQGEVEMISMMPPKGKTESDEGLLEYLEDIIGSSKYVEETNQAALKVESMETLRQEKLNRVKAVEKEKDNLEGARQEAEALLAQEREIRRKKNILYQIHKMKADKTSEKLTGQKQAIVEKLSAARERLANENERVEEIESGLSQQRKGYDKIHAELKKTKEEFLAYERRDVQLREEIKHAKAQLKKLEAKIATEDRNETEANVKREQAKQAIPELETKIEELNAKKESVDRKVEQILEERKGETEALREDLEVKTKELAPLKQERGIHQAAFDTAQGAVDILEESANRAKAKLEASEKELASLDSKQQSKKNELVKCQEELDAAKKRIVEAEVEEKELGAQEATLASRSKTLMVRKTDYELKKNQAAFVLP